MSEERVCYLDEKKGTIGTRHQVPTHSLYSVLERALTRFSLTRPIAGNFHLTQYAKAWKV